MMNVDELYLGIAQDILDFGEEREDRTGTGTISLFSPRDIRVDLTKGFPMLTTKKLHIPSIVIELLWFLEGNTNVHDLQARGIRIWDADYERAEKAGTHSDGDLGPIYGKQWRDWQGLCHHKGEDVECYVDQIMALIYGIQRNPTSRRHVVNAWNVAQLDDMALPPCHVMFQAYAHEDGGLSLKMYQRSADWFLGVPFNIASYALLTHMIAQVTGRHAKQLILTFGDAHIYKNHIEQINEQMTREPKPLPQLILNPDIKNIDDFKAEDIRFIGYDPHKTIKGRISAG